MRQHQRLAGNLSVQLAKSNNRARKRQATNEYAKEDFDLVNQALISGCEIQLMIAVHQPVTQAHQHRRQPHKAVQDRDQLRHRSHFDFRSNKYPDRRTNHQRDHDSDIATLNHATTEKQQGADGNHNTDDAVPVTTASRFVLAESAEAKDEQNPGGQECQLQSIFRQEIV